jgi:hypothetical protein
MKHWIIPCLAAMALTTSGFAAEPRKDKPTTSNSKPLAYANAISLFKSAHLRTTEAQKRCTVFFEGEWTSANVYNYCLIIVENSDEDIQVTFYLTDAHEMNWVTEFLDGPFFARDETERLFALMNSGREIRGKNVGRFLVDFHRWQPRHAEIIVFSFTPVQARLG